jgi:uroporphyrinogen-III synthase
MKVLSTKKLKPNQRDLLLGSGCSLVDYDAIAIEHLDFTIPSILENTIFTSQHGVKAFFKNAEKQHKIILLKRCFCVGQKTKALLEQNGQKVIKMAQNSAALGDFIQKNHQNEVFYYFCGSHRRDELPAILKQAKIELFEVKTYKIELKPHKFDQKWDKILFFSPSGVQSFMLENQIKNAMAICIGETTAAEARKHTSNIFVSNATSVESVLAKAVKIITK